MKDIPDFINWLYQMDIELSSDIPFNFSNTASKSPIIQKDNNNQTHSSVSNNQSYNNIKSEKDIYSMINSCHNIEELKDLLLNFNGCDLKKTALNTVFADGSPKAKIMLIGEAPGATEDAKGIPFCGESGALLDNIFSSINLSRNNDLYITNSVFWRPPANRRPTTEEIEICKPFLEKHISLINPKLIILVGSTAVSAVLGHHFKISQVRGKFLTYKNPYLSESISLTSIFHPAYLLRQPSQKKDTWYDILNIDKYLSAN